VCVCVCVCDSCWVLSRVTRRQRIVIRLCVCVCVCWWLSELSGVLCVGVIVVGW